MRMYVANCTNQVQDFIYRLPERAGLIQQRIGAGEQIKLTPELTTPDIDAIISQHGKYGMVRADEVDRTRPFIGLCYSIDKPVNLSHMRRAAEHNVGVLDRWGRQIREEAAIVINEQNEQAVGGPQNVKSTEISLEEVPAKDGAPATINETIRVSRREGTSGPRPAPQRRRRAA